MRDTAGAEPLFSYWSGPVSWMERLSVASAQALGYDVTVFSFESDELRRSGLGCTIADARSIMARPTPEQYRSVGPAHMTDHFRLEGIAQGCGTWFDLDIVFIGRLPSEPYLFGMHTEKALNNAILRFPADSAILAEYLGMCRQRRGVYQFPPWYPLPRRVARATKTAFCRITGLRPPGPMYGPRTLTHLVRKHGLMHLAKPPIVFYPVPSNKLAVTEMALQWPDSAIGPETVCVHLWRSFWDRPFRQAPPWATRVLAAASRVSRAAA